MSNQSLYKSIITAKNGTNIPVFLDGRTVDSKYNPEREAEKIINTVINELKSSEKTLREKENICYRSDLFFVIIGIASGTLIEKITDFFPYVTIVAVEACDADLDFLSQLEKIKKIKSNKNVILTDINNIEKVLVNNYLPAIYNEFKVIEQIGWIQENKELVKILNDKINKAIRIISADFSVQSHFGKIWQANIINNLKNLSYSNDTVYDFDTEMLNKTAAVIAAGPSLDTTIKNIKNNREKYYIISTDTAFSSLIKNNISSDIVISLDGQHISHNHFSSLKKYDNTIFCMDLCSDYSTGKYLQDKNCKLVYFTSGHPLSNLANYISNNKFIELFSGAGTVTISAVDLALKLGFINIEIYGADFSYFNGKSYTKGTYFDTLFNINNSKIHTTEYQYSHLIFRTKLEKISKNSYTTDILTAYRMSLEQFLADNNCSFTNDKFIYKVKLDKCKKKPNKLQSFSYNYQDFLSVIKRASKEELKYPLLPYIAWLKNNKNNKSLEFIALLKLAQSNIEEYN